MKPTKLIAISTLLLLGISTVSAQSLGDYARTARKNKTETASATHHYDNDNLPTNEVLSVVGPAPTSNANTGNDKAADPAAAAAERQRMTEDWQKKLDQQKQKIDSLNHELDLDQREYRLRAAEIYGDAGNRLRNAAEWDKEDRQFRSDIDEKQKAITSAQQQLSEMQEQARKAGAPERDTDKDSDKPKASDNGKDKDK